MFVFLTVGYVFKKMIWSKNRKFCYRTTNFLVYKSKTNFILSLLSVMYSKVCHTQLNKPSILLDQAVVLSKKTEFL
jgi:hypothetical protein